MIINNEPGYYYVSVIRDSRKVLALGPFADHQTAIGKIDAVQAFCCEHDPRAWFDAYGTARYNGDDAPSGKLNNALQSLLIP